MNEERFSSPPKLLYALRCLLFLSGFSGLVLEVGWTRLVSGIVGATSVGMTCIFFVFILSLALGSFIASRSRARGGDALRLYGILELLVGISGLLVTLILLRHSSTLANWCAALPSPHPLASQLLLTFLLIGFPSTLMGLTLPVVLNAVHDEAVPREQVAVLYGLNVLGGAFGALAAGFILIWQLGVTGTASAVLGLNVLIAAASFALAGPRSAPVADAEGGPTTAPAPHRLPMFMVFLAFLCGGISLTFELLWGRVAKLFLGDRTLATSALLFVYLFCLAAGSFIANRLRRDVDDDAHRPAMFEFGGLVAAAGLLQLLAFRIMHGFIEAGLANAAVSVRVVAAFVIMLLPVAILGISFPYLMRVSPELNRLPGRTTGILYGANSLGSAMGAVVGGYLLPRTLGTVYGFVLCAAILAAVGIYCLRASKHPALTNARLGLLAVLFVAAAAIVPRSLSFYNKKKETLLMEHEDEYGIQLVTRSPQGHLKVKNNRIFIAYHFGHPGTTFTQESIAYFSCMLSNRCETVMNIGTGYGITAGAFTLFEDVRSLTTVEVLPFAFRNQELFRSKNYEYYKDPRVKRYCTDGRHLLVSDDRKYDVISVNVLDPYLPGSGALFTTDFWREAKVHLNPGGAYSQLIWGPDRELLLRGMIQVFPRLYLFRTQYADAFNVVALADERPAALPLQRLSPRILASLKQQGVHDPVAWAEEEIAVARENERSFKTANDWPLGRDRLHTEDRPNLEFQWSHGLHYVSSFDSLQAHDYE